MPDPVAGAPPHWTVEIRRSDRRSLGLEVRADLRVIACVPRSCPDATVDAFVASRTPWIVRQLEYFARRPAPPAARYTDGEIHWFLGAPLRLRLAPRAPRGIVHRPGVLEVGGAHAGDSVRTGRAVQRWFRAQARVTFEILIRQWQAHPRFARYPVPTLRVRQMRTRWGSFSPQGGMTLNLALIRAPRSAIEYVVVHELCHYRYRGHGKGFYTLLEAVMPDWRARKRLLESSAAAHGAAR